MRFLIQRVSKARIHIIDTNTTHQIGQWYLIYFWVHKDDLETKRKDQIDTFVRRVWRFDLFSSDQKKKHLWLNDIEGELLIVSNFTLYGRNKKGSSIDFCHAAPYEEAEKVYDYFIEQLNKEGYAVKTGKFGAQMEITSTNFGPVNIILER